ncbi:uncharacterized protein BDR25DRAFT_228290, partial [Lindgomyces ingoldianus]
VQCINLAIQAIQSATARDAKDWAPLFRSADVRFELGDITNPPGSNPCLRYATW